MSASDMKFEAEEGAGIEVAFSFDTTGSMARALQQVRENLKEIATKLTKEIPEIRIAMIAHGDYCDYSSPTYVTKILDFTHDVNALVTFANDTPSTSGGDAPECYELVLREACSLNWSDNSAKALVVIGDNNPHPPSMTDQKIYWKKEMKNLKSKGVKIYSVGVSVGGSARAFYECLAESTGGAFIEFANFSLITDMFMAICYKSASDDRYAAFRKKMQEKAAKQENLTTEASKELEQMMKKLDEVVPKNYEVKESAEVPDEIPDRWKLSEAWWNPDAYDDLSKKPTYRYNPSTKKWSPNT